MAFPQIPVYSNGRNPPLRFEKEFLKSYPLVPLLWESRVPWGQRTVPSCLRRLGPTAEPDWGSPSNGGPSPPHPPTASPR